MMISVPMNEGDCICTAVARQMGLDMWQLRNAECTMDNCQAHRQEEFNGDFVEYFQEGYET